MGFIWSELNKQCLISEITMTTPREPFLMCTVDMDKTRLGRISQLAPSTVPPPVLSPVLAGVTSVPLRQEIPAPGGSGHGQHAPMIPKIVLLPLASRSVQKKSGSGSALVSSNAASASLSSFCFPLSSSDSISPPAFLLSRPHSYLPFDGLTTGSAPAAGALSPRQVISSFARG